MPLEVLLVTPSRYSLAQALDWPQRTHITVGDISVDVVPARLHKLVGEFLLGFWQRGIAGTLAGIRGISSWTRKTKV